MRFLIVTLLLVAASIAYAQTFTYTSTGTINGVPSQITTTVTITPISGNSGKILLVDGVSHLLSRDNASKICRAGGC